MAHMNQTKKAVIAAALKQVVPAGWKYSLSVDNYSSICMTIKSAPIDLLRCFDESPFYKHETATNVHVNQYHFQNHVADAEVRATFVKIFEALNIGNWDNSDSQTDYFDVGHYVDVTIGKWDKPFVVTEQLKQAA